MSFFLNGLIGSYFLNGIDDLVMDISYYASKEKPIKKYELKSKPPQNTAVLIPAWKEETVIEETVQSFEGIDYPKENFDIFLGVYQNDTPTRKKAERLKHEFSNVKVSVNTKNGPTNKADNLNAVLGEISKVEKSEEKKYDIFALNDAEDDVHPDILRMYNYLIPKYDMVQLPVIPHKPSSNSMVGKTIQGVYCDEFAENHGRIMKARENIGGFVPAAGTGTAFSRQALEDVYDQYGYVFNSENHTEDYEISMRLMELGKKATFAKGYFDEDKFISVHVSENFPDTAKSSIKQKARWNRGIILETPKQRGIKGTLPQKYTIAKDLKSAGVNILSMAGYAAIPAMLISNETLIEQGSTWYYMALFDLGLMANRLATKASCVNNFYGPKQALLSIPRTFVGNAINCASTLKSFKDHIGSEIFGNDVMWEHTYHEPRKNMIEKQKEINMPTNKQKNSLKK